MAPAQVARHRRKAETRSARQRDSRRRECGSPPVTLPVHAAASRRDGDPQEDPAFRGPGEAPPGGRGRREAGLCALNPAVQTLRKPAQRIGRSRCAFLPRLFPAEARPCAALFSGRGGQTNRAARPAVKAARCWAERVERGARVPIPPCQTAAHRSLVLHELGSGRWARRSRGSGVSPAARPANRP